MQISLKDPRLPHVCVKKCPAVIENEHIAIIDQWKAREGWQMLFATRAMLVEADSLSRVRHYPSHIFNARGGYL